MPSRLDELRFALRSNPQNQSLLLDFANQALREKEMEDAVEGFRKLLKLNARKTEAWLGLAESLHALGRSSEAAVRLENLLQNRPDCARAYLLLARIYLAEGERMEALKHWRRSQQLDASLEDADLQAAFAGLRASEGRLRKAVEESSWSMENEEGMGEDEDSFDEGFQLEDFAPASITLKEVMGLKAASKQMLALLQEPSAKMKRLLGQQSRGGVLLYGPPGCGKTMLAQAVAGEAKVPFLRIGLHQLLDSYIGNAEKNVHDLFELAASSGACVLFFDELEAIGSQQMDQARFTPTKTLFTQLLMELDGLKADSQILVVGATSSPWELDPALLRAGRLSNLQFIAPPKDEVRKVALERVFAEIGGGLSEVFLQTLLEQTQGFSVAEIRAQLSVWFLDAGGGGQEELFVRGLLRSEYEQALVTHLAEFSPALLRWKQEAQAKMNQGAGLSFPKLQELG